MRKFTLLLITMLLLACSHGPKKIGIQPYGMISQHILDSISVIIKRSYHAEVVILNSRELPFYAFVNIKTPRYRADSLLLDLRENRQDSIDIVIGITTKDISTTKRDARGKVKSPKSKYLDWGIFGLGNNPGNSCVISTFRLHTANANLFMSRIQKIAVHEIGHTMGLDHCETDNCVMQDAVETINTIDNEGYQLCERCSEKI